MSREDVYRFVAEWTRYPAEKLEPGTTLFGDLGVDGDDARDLLGAFARRFEVELDAFPFPRYFGPEGFTLRALAHWLAQVVKGGSPEARAGLEPVHLRDLVRAAEAGRWPTP